MSRLAIEAEEGGQILLVPSLRARAINSIGTKEYHQLFISRGEGGEKEVIKGGEYACAFQTTAMYHNYGLLKATHTTVDGFEAEVQATWDWLRIDEALPGAIGILERKKELDGSLGTRHTFICIGGGEAVHNEADPAIRSPQKIRISDFKHHTGESRKVEALYIHRRVLAELQSAA